MVSTIVLVAQARGLTPRIPGILKETLRVSEVEEAAKGQS